MNGSWFLREFGSLAVLSEIVCSQFSWWLTVREAVFTDLSRWLEQIQCWKSLLSWTEVSDLIFTMACEGLDCCWRRGFLFQMKISRFRREQIWSLQKVILCQVSFLPISEALPLLSRGNIIHSFLCFCPEISHLHKHIQSFLQRVDVYYCHEYLPFCLNVVSCHAFHTKFTSFISMAV